MKTKKKSTFFVLNRNYIKVVNMHFFIPRICIKLLILFIFIVVEREKEEKP